MEEHDSVASISGNDVIMAYEGRPQTFERKESYVQHSSDRGRCTCLFWSRYILFVLNFLILVAGAAMIALGSWALVNGAGLKLFQTLLIHPSWMLVAIGIVMVLLGVFGCAGALRLNIIFLRVFMVLVVIVFILQLALAATVFLMMDDLQYDMLNVTKEVMLSYGQDSGNEDDIALDYIQREFSCCGATSYLDWNANPFYNCSRPVAATACGVPSSCCRGTRDTLCGVGLRDGTKQYFEMFAYSEGCVVKLMDIFKENITVIVGIAFTVSFLELCCLILANIVVRNMVYHRKLIS